MAGYDFDFEIPARFREEARSWLRFFQKYGQLNNLQVRFHTSIFNHRIASIYVSVDGPLACMQLLHRLLPKQLIGYLLPRAGHKRLFSNVISPFIEANERGLRGITDLVFYVSGQINGIITGVTVPNLVFGSRFLEQMTLQRPRTREDRALQDIGNALDSFLTSRISREQAMIASDQSCESWFKARLGIPGNTRINFPDLLNRGKQVGLLTGREAYRFRLIHRARNRAQHRGQRIHAETARQMFFFIIRYLNAKI